MENLRLGLNYKVEFNKNAFVTDLRNFNRAFGEAVIRAAVPRIYKFAQDEIAGYYGEYTPKYYNRENVSPEQMLRHSFKIFRNRQNGEKYEGGLLFYPEFTDHVIKGISEEQIYTSVWDLGLHGRRVVGEDKEVEYIEGKPERFGRITKMVESDEFRNEMFEIGMRAAKAQSYSTIVFR